MVTATGCRAIAAFSYSSEFGGTFVNFVTLTLPSTGLSKQAPSKDVYG